MGNGPAVDTVSPSGTLSFADGTPVAAMSVQVQLVLDGSSLFQAGVDGCLPTPAHVAGTVIDATRSDSLGRYSLEVPVASLHAAVVRQCAIKHLNSSQINGLLIRTSILADDTTCPAFCSAQGDPSADCVTSCATGNRNIIASHSVTSDELAALVASIRTGKLIWSQPLVFSQLGPALADGAGPDLVVDGDAAKTSAYVTQESFAPGSCEVAEGCVRAPGQRTLLRFDGTIENLGSGDLVIGSPDNSPLFTLDSCHKVELLKDIMRYELVYSSGPSNGTVVTVGGQDVVGRKQGFCMMDIMQVNASAPQGQYDCQNQGLTAGWADVYDAALDCQFLDVTGVVPGNYTLRLTVNPNGLFDETDTSNNSVDVPVVLPTAHASSTSHRGPRP